MKRLAARLVMLVMLAGLFVAGFRGGVGVREVRAQKAEGEGAGGKEEMGVKERQARLRDGMWKLRDNRGKLALERFREIIEKSPKNSLAYHVASVLSNQMNGGFAKRQAGFLKRKIVDTVVLVKDEVSLLEAIAAWPADRFWPVLIEDEWYAPLFVEAFKPRKVVRWRSKNTATNALGRGVRELKVVAKLAELIKAHNKRFTRIKKEVMPPPGLVVVDSKSGLRAGGFALAVGRFQPIMVLPTTDDGKKVVEKAYVDQLNEYVAKAALKLKLFRTEQWCAITLAGRYALKYKDLKISKAPLAVDDALARDSRRLRLGVVGRLFGTSVQGVYQAMCSMFLQPKDALLFNTYWYDAKKSKRFGGFADYHMTWAARNFGKQWKVTLYQNHTAKIDQFRKAVQGKNLGAHDVFWVNSSGGSRDLSISGTKIEGDDIPVGKARLFNVVASFSSTDPWNEGTICARALAGGAWWYYGSTQEPYLTGFVQSTVFSLRAGVGTPLAFAARHVPGHPMYKPWKLALIGDPLFAMRKKVAERVEEGLGLKGEVEVKKGAKVDGGMGAKLGHALLVGDDEHKLLIAKALLLGGAKVKATAGEYAQAVRVVAQAEGQGAVANLPYKLAGRHLVGGMIVRRAMLGQFRDEIGRGELGVAKLSMEVLLGRGISKSMAQRVVRQWVMAMEKAKRGPEAVGVLGELAKKRYSPSVRAVLRSEMGRAVKGK